MITSLIFSIVVWHLIRCKLIRLTKLLFKIKPLQLHKYLKPIELKILNSIIITIVLLSIITVILDVYYVEYGLELQQKIFTFNNVFESHFAKILSRLDLFTIYFITRYQFPWIGTLFCCIMYYQLSVNILNFTKKTKLEFNKHFCAEHCVHIFQNLSRLIDFSNKLDKLLSPVCFYLLSLHMVLLFASVASVVQINVSNMDIPYFIEYLTALISSLIGISSIIICGSLIENRFLDIKRNIIRMHEMYISFPRKDNFTLQLIRYMISMDLPVMTAWSIFALKPSLIFSIICACLTFGLLCVQIIP